MSTAPAIPFGIRSNHPPGAPPLSRFGIPLVRLLLSFAALSFLSGSARAKEPIFLASGPTLSPDGKTLVFSWAGDLWSVPTAGGVAVPLTRSTADDTEPRFSPDGKTIAFVSDRDGASQIYRMPAAGGPATQLTFHSSGSRLEGWFPDGKSLLVSAARDHSWRKADRFFRIDAEKRGPETLIFDAESRTGSLSPDGTKLLFCREGTQWWRKGYVGSQASQIWLYDLAAKSFTKILDPPGGALFPVWKNKDGFYYVGVHNKAFNVREYDLGSKNDKALTDFGDESVVFPVKSADGSTLVFRRLFDFYSLDLRNPAAKPAKLDISYEGDPIRKPIDRKTLTTATDVAFTDDGLEIAFIAGGDLWVMDTELREPVQVTNTPEDESSPVFTRDGKALIFVSDAGGKSDIHRAERADASVDWWRNQKFKLTRMTDDDAVESGLKLSPDGARLAFVKGRGDLWVIQPDGNNARKIHSSWNEPDFDWSPDGAWIVYAEYDNDFNRDIWIKPIDGSRAPFNLSRHPDNEGSPAWSPDGKIIAFSGRRVDRETDIYYVYLQEDDDQRTSREKALEKAIEKTKKARAGRGTLRALAEAKTAATTKSAPAGATPPAIPPSASSPRKPAAVVIDFDRLPERLKRVSIANSDENGLIWSPDSKRLGFRGSVDGRSGFYTIDIPDGGRPSLVASPGGSRARWLAETNQLVWLSQGVPASVSVGGGGGSIGSSSSLPSGLASRFGLGGGGGSSSDAPAPSSGSGRETTYRFSARQVVDVSKRYQYGFDVAWRIMRDNWYDERLGNRDWNKIRAKYREQAGMCRDNDTFATVVNLMLGELNGSHLGFSARPSLPDEPTPGPGPGPATPGPNVPPGLAGLLGGSRSWSPVTPHLGIRFSDEAGPGLRVRDVIPDGPADLKKSRVAPGETVLTIDGTKVGPETDMTELLNGPLDRDIVLRVQGLDGKERDVVIRPTSFGSVGSRLYEKWIRDNRAMVEKLSNGKLGYLHIRGMDFTSFYRFEEELYSAGVGKDGLIIDVRENGGGSTADHLLTALTQPTHAIAVPRGGGRGYPQDRRVYAVWDKPILVLCNQNSFSNAEIFSHAIKMLGRGKLVGVPTAGGVVSTGSARVSDLGVLRLPFRGWYSAKDGEDMELNGAVPDVIVWPDPADFAKGVDKQIEKGVEVLLEDVVRERAKPPIRLRKATERPGR
ncbi:MAG: S41 family peptidase [Isosphaeraceae bacterium]|nr:S41 family peptidase [Isosphaeraceae bacterium]